METYKERTETTEKIESTEKENLETISLSEVCEKHEVFILHGIHATHSVGDNSLLNKNVDWKTKLDIALTLRPTLSTSSIREGEAFWDNNGVNLWSRMGIVLSEGEITEAHLKDAGSKPKNLQERYSYLGKATDIEIAINKKRDPNFKSRSNYNEIIVTNPKPLGFYICSDPLPDKHESYDMAPSYEIFEKVRERNIPLLVLSKGELYQTPKDSSYQDIFFTVHKLQNEREETINKMITSGWEKVDYSKLKEQSIKETNDPNELMKGLVENGTFNLRVLSEHLPFIDEIKSVSFGREAYYSLQEKDALENLSKPKFLEGEGEVQVVDAFYNGDTPQVIYKGDKGNYYIKGVYNDNVRRNNLRYSSERGAIRIGHGLESTLSEKPLTDINSYLTNITPKLEDLKKWSSNDQERGEKNYRQVLFHLYGFGKQAEMLGDQETAEKAKTIINNLIDYNELQKIVQERMADNGSVKISLEDLRPK